MTLEFIFYQVHLNSTIQSDQFIFFLFCFVLDSRIETFQSFSICSKILGVSDMQLYFWPIIAY